MNDHFFNDNILRFNVYLLIDKFDLIIFIAFKMFFNDAKYDNNRYIRFRNDYDIKFGNY